MTVDGAPRYGESLLNGILPKISNYALRTNGDSHFRLGHSQSDRVKRKARLFWDSGAEQHSKKSNGAFFAIRTSTMRHS